MAPPLFYWPPRSPEEPREVSGTSRPSPALSLAAGVCVRAPESVDKLVIGPVTRSRPPRSRPPPGRATPRTMRFKARLQNEGIIVFSNIISALDKIGSKCMMHLTKEKVSNATKLLATASPLPPPR